MLSYLQLLLQQLRMYILRALVSGVWRRGGCMVFGLGPNNALRFIRLFLAQAAL